MAGILGYAATKVFGSYLGQGLYYELKGYGVDVLSYEAGAVSTKMMKGHDDGANVISASRSAEVCFRDIGNMPMTFGAFRHEYPMWILGALPISLF